MKKLLSAEYHSLTLRSFGPDDTPTLEGRFGPYSLRNKSDRGQLQRMVDHINRQLQAEGTK